MLDLPLKEPCIRLATAADEQLGLTRKIDVDLPYLASRNNCISLLLGCRNTYYLSTSDYSV